MEKKIYVVKTGRRPGIYDKWEKCEPQVKWVHGAKYRGFNYRTELEAEDETQEGSLRHAFLQAEAYMHDVGIGGLKLVYQGENPDYPEEESWKKEGFLPFVEEAPGKEAPGPADDPQDGDPNGDSEAAGDAGENEGTGQAVGAGASTATVTERSLAEDVPFEIAAFESCKKQKPSPGEPAVQEHDHTKEEEVYRKLQIPERPNRNRPWVEILAYIAGYRPPQESYVGRYHVPTLYVLLLKFVFKPDSVLFQFVKVYKDHIFPKIKADVSLEGSAAEWFDAACAAWKGSDEYRALKQHFEKNGMEYLDFDEIFRRYQALVKDDAESALRTKTKAYRAMKEYLKQGGRSLSDLYRELTENEAYREELSKVSDRYDNPDLGKVLSGMPAGASFRPQPGQQNKQLLLYTESIGVKLKEQVIGQDDAIDKLKSAFFHTESARNGGKRKGPGSVFLFAGPSGVGKTFTAELFKDALGLPYKRLDMSGYAVRESSMMLAGSSKKYSNTQTGVLTDFVAKNPHSVVLFDEIEKAHREVIYLLLQILDEGTCFDESKETNISFEDTILIFTTNAGKQRYGDAIDENLTLLPDKVVLDALAKDINPATGEPFFPPEILSRFSSHTVIMFNHLKADTLRQVVEQDVEKQLILAQQQNGYDLSVGKGDLARTVLYSMGGSADARNASVLAGKLIQRQLYEFSILMMQKKLDDNLEDLKRIEWHCDFSEASEEVKGLYTGEKNRAIPVFGAMPYQPSGCLKENAVCVQNTTDPDAFMDMLHAGNVLFAVIDYTLGLNEGEKILNITGAKTAGREVFLRTAKEFADTPVYILYGGKLPGGKPAYVYTDREKNDLLKRGAGGFVNREFYAAALEAAYWEVCCQKAMNTLARRHQVLTYETNPALDAGHEDVGRIVFYNLKLETAVESEDTSSLLSDVERPDTKFSEVIGAEEAKRELQFYAQYLKKPKGARKGIAVIPSGILLYGAPGTGKTMLARALAGQSDVSFLATSATGFMASRVGESEANIRRLFAKARKYAPAILFIDEIDAIGKKRTGSETTHHTENMLDALLTEMDGFQNADGSRPVLVLAATNHKDRLDEALLRRFESQIHVGRPNEGERKQYIGMLAGKYGVAVSEEAARTVAEQTEGQSLADLKSMLKHAFHEAVRQERDMTDHDLLSALKASKALPADAERPNVIFSDVIGAESAKRELLDFTEYLREPKKYLEKGGIPPKGVLLYGPHGTGKTMLARALAGESDVTFLAASATEFMASHVGESEANIRQLFEKARKHAPAVIFIDEIDAIGKKRTGSETTHHTETMLNTLLTEMDGFRGADIHKPVFVLAATNLYSMLDGALLRRFDSKIFVGLPRENDRKRYILKLCDDRNITTVSEEAAHNIAQRSAHMSLADLEQVFKRAVREAGRLGRDLTDDDLLGALEVIKFGEIQESSPEQRRKTAIHEIGHAYVSYLNGNKPSFISIESRGNHFGYTQPANQEDMAEYTKEELLARIRSFLAGRAAEQVFYGKEKSRNTGASSDLERATNLAFQMVCRFGMEEDQLVVLSKETILNSALAGEYVAKANGILKAEMKNTVGMIENAKDTIQKIADVLFEENRLTGEQFEKLMEADG